MSRQSRSYWVYIMTNRSRTLYTGMTNDLQRRVAEHKLKTSRGFTSKYKIDRLVWYLEFDDVDEAIPFREEDQRLEALQENRPD